MMDGLGGPVPLGAEEHPRAATPTPAHPAASGLNAAAAPQVCKMLPPLQLLCLGSFCLFRFF